MHANDQAFWIALQDSQLLTVTQRKWIKKEWFGKSNAAQASEALESVIGGESTSSSKQSLARQLVEKKWLTPFQASLLESLAENATPARGKVRPFVYGPFVLQNRLHRPRAFSAHQYLCGLTTEHADNQFDRAKFVARFLPHSDDAVWTALKSHCQTEPSPHLLPPIACIQLPDYRAVLEFDYSKFLTPLASLLGDQVSETKSAVKPNQVLAIAAGITTALTQLHGKQKTVGILTPVDVFLNSEGQGYLRELSDSILQSPQFARAVLGIRAEPNEADTNQPILVTTDKPKPEEDSDAWKADLCLPITCVPHPNEKTPQTSHWSTADFLAPELFAGGIATPASDLYSLGCLLYFLATGSVPFPGETWVAKHLARNKKPAPHPEVAKPIQKILDLLLEPNPEDRKVSAAKIEKSLRSLLSVQPQPCSELLDSSRIQSAYQWLQLQDGPVFPEVDELDDSIFPNVDAAKDFAPVVVPSVTSSSDIVINAPDAEPKRRWEAEEKRSTPMVWIAGAAGFLAMTLVGLWLAGVFSSGTPQQTADSESSTDENQNQNVVIQSDDNAFDPTNGWTQRVVSDDGKLLWESPTVGMPLQLQALPPNPYSVCVIKKDFWTRAPYQQLLAAVAGIKSQGLADSIEQQIQQLNVEAFDTTLLAQYQSNNQPQNLIRLTSAADVFFDLKGWKAVGQIQSLPGDLFAAAMDSSANNDTDSELQNGATDIASIDQTVAEQNDDAVTEPPNAANSDRIVLVRKQAGQTQVAIIRGQNFSDDTLQSLPVLPLDRLQIEMFDPEYAEAPWTDQVKVNEVTLCDPELAILALPESGRTQLTLPMSTALDCSDEDRHFQLITNPVAIWNEAGRSWLGEERQWFADMVKIHLPLQTRSLYFSTHFADDQVYLEAKFVIDRSANAAGFLKTVTDKISGASGDVERMILSVPRLEYWDTGLLRFDDMLKQVGTSLRTGQHNRIPTINSWLPRPAVASLIAETDLFYTAAQFSNQSVAAKSSTDSTPKDLAQLLDAKRTVKIPEQDLINALVDMQSEIKSSYPGLSFDFQFELDGNSLLTDGITQNQKITDFELVDQPLSEILTALVLKANPDKSVTTANDPNCKLIWLPHPEKSNVVLVTTRAAAEKNSWELPPQVALEE